MYLFETMRLQEGVIPRFQYHSARIQQSAKQLNYPFTKAEFEQYIERIQRTYPQGVHRLKVMLQENGELSYQCVDLPNKTHFTAQTQMMNPHYPKWQYTNKTSERTHVTHHHETDVVLYYDEQGKVLEFDIGNVLIKEHNQYYTPTYAHDLLRGCMRAQLLDEGKVIEKDYTIENLKAKLEAGEAEIFLINSLREVAEIQINL